MLSICLLTPPGFYDQRRGWLYDESTDGDRTTRSARGPECTAWVITTVPPHIYAAGALGGVAVTYDCAHTFAHTHMVYI